MTPAAWGVPTASQRAEESWVPRKWGSRGGGGNCGLGGSNPIAKNCGKIAEKLRKIVENCGKIEEKLRCRKRPS